MCTRTSTCRSAVQRHATISRRARARRRSAAPPRIVDFAIQPRGTQHARRARHLVEEGGWPRVHRLRSAHDRHGSGRSGPGRHGRRWSHEGIASFKLFMAYPNVLMVDDATIFKALSQTAKNGALICMHAENGSVIDVIYRARARRRQDRADLSRLDAAADARRRKRCIARSRWPRLRACRSTSCICRRKTL